MMFCALKGSNVGQNSILLHQTLQTNKYPPPHTLELLRHLFLGFEVIMFGIPVMPEFQTNFLEFQNRASFSSNPLKLILEYPISDNNHILVATTNNIIVNHSCIVVHMLPIVLPICVVHVVLYNDVYNIHCNDGYGWFMALS